MSYANTMLALGQSPSQIGSSPDFYPRPLASYRNAGEGQKILDALGNVIGDDGIKTDIKISLYPMEYVKMGFAVGGGVLIGMIFYGFFRAITKSN
jgi:hypothetical protein